MDKAAYVLVGSRRVGCSDVDCSIGKTVIDDSVSHWLLSGSPCFPLVSHVPVCVCVCVRVPIGSPGNAPALGVPFEPAV